MRLSVYAIRETTCFTFTFQKDLHIRKHSENLSSRQNTRQINVKRFIFDKYFLKMYDVEGFYNSLDIKKKPLLINLSVNFFLTKITGICLVYSSAT